MLDIPMLQIMCISWCVWRQIYMKPSSCHHQCHKHIHHLEKFSSPNFVFFPLFVVRALNIRSTPSAYFKVYNTVLLIIVPILIPFSLITKILSIPTPQTYLRQIVFRSRSEQFFLFHPNFYFEKNSQIYTVIYKTSNSSPLPLLLKKIKPKLRQTNRTSEIYRMISVFIPGQCGFSDIILNSHPHI